MSQRFRVVLIRILCLSSHTTDSTLFSSMHDIFMIIYFKVKAKRKGCRSTDHQLVVEEKKLPLFVVFTCDELRIFRIQDEHLFAPSPPALLTSSSRLWLLTRQFLWSNSFFCHYLFTQGVCIFILLMACLTVVLIR